MAIRSIDKERLKHINFVMDDLHSSLNQVYEHLVDREFPELKKEIISLTNKLNKIIESVQDET
jgi:phage terminase Nu1 subunit (DNA packaging protein)